MAKVTIHFKHDNTVTFNAERFAFDGCHKFYIIEDDKDELEAKEYQYDIFPIKKLKAKWRNSCPLRFIENWKLSECYVGQFERVVLIEIKENKQ